MKYLRIRSRPDLAAAPSFLGVILDSAFVDEGRLLGLNPTDSRGVTGLMAVDGDAERFREAVTGAESFRSIAVTPAGEDRFYVFATLDPREAPLPRQVLAALTRDGMVILTPVVYRDGCVHVRLVGETDAVGSAVEALPDAVEVDVREIGRLGFEADSAVAELTDRQREVLHAAMEMGYYETPRGTTHEAIAERLGVAPSTVSEHIKRAETRIIRRVLSTSDPTDADR
ncbi:DNA-binding protein [Halobacteriales archaeon QS_8_69_26]|nr:MAG: DNA-binding protein [Halobacteriales archaeon QS_8_69_26]